MKFTEPVTQYQGKTQIEDLEGFEELSDVEAMAVVGGGLLDGGLLGGLLGGLTGGLGVAEVTSELSPGVSFIDQTTNFDALGNAVGEIGGFVTAD